MAEKQSLAALAPLAEKEGLLKHTLVIVASAKHAPPSRF